jgi:hypothetical protein
MRSKQFEQNINIQTRADLKYHLKNPSGKWNVILR